MGANNKPDGERRRFLTTAATVVGGAGVAAATVPFVAMLVPSARTRVAGGPVGADVSQLTPGEWMKVKWRGKPVWILRRDEETLVHLPTLDDELADPASEKEGQQPEYARNVHRSRRPEFLVVIGLCTHLGCSPEYLPPEQPYDYGKNWRGGFKCFCHGSHFDLAGRVYKGVPAPHNLQVPPYYFIDDDHIQIGEASPA